MPRGTSPCSEERSTSVSDDPRVQVVVIAFCFGALLEALAGFGTPVAICGVMLVGLGFSPLQRGVARARRRHRPGRVRRDRDPDHHARAGVGPARAPPEHDGRPPDAVLRADRPVRAGVHGRRAPRRPRGVAGGADRGTRVRAPAVRHLELHLDAADRHRRLARLGRGGRAAGPGVVARTRRARPRPALGRRPAIAGGAVADAALERRARADGPADPPPSRRGHASRRSRPTSSSSSCSG